MHKQTRLADTGIDAEAQGLQTKTGEGKPSPVFNIKCLSEPTLEVGTTVLSCARGCNADGIGQSSRRVGVAKARER